MKELVKVIGLIVTIAVMVFLIFNRVCFKTLVIRSLILMGGIYLGGFVFYIISMIVLEERSEEIITEDVEEIPPETGPKNAGEE